MRFSGLRAWSKHSPVSSQFSIHVAKENLKFSAAHFIAYPGFREALHGHLDQFAAGVEAFARESGMRYDLIHSHYWLSGVAGLRLRERWGTPLVQMFHTLAKLKNAVAHSEAEREPSLREEEESRIVAQADRVVAANVVERAHLVWYYGARAERIAVIPCGVDTDLFQPMDPAKAKDLPKKP